MAFGLWDFFFNCLLLAKKKRRKEIDESLERKCDEDRTVHAKNRNASEHLFPAHLGFPCAGKRRVGWEPISCHLHFECDFELKKKSE